MVEEKEQRSANLGGLDDLAKGKRTPMVVVLDAWLRGSI